MGTTSSPDDHSDDTPPDIDAIRNRLARRLHVLISNQQRRWLSCREPGCRRARACLAPHIKCSNPKPGPQPSEEDIAQTKALVYRALQEAADRNGA